MKEAIGTMQCPLSVAAGQPHEAHIFEQSSKRRPLYWRCECGTLQPLREEGQILMAAVTKSATVAKAPAEPKAPEPSPERDPDPAESAEPEAKAKPRDKGLAGIFDGFLSGGDDEEI